MKVLKTYEGVQALKHIQYDKDDVKEFMSRFNMDEKTAKNLCKYLKDKNKVVDVIDVYDPQSCWRGFDFVIENKNLSVNGYNFKPENVNKFLNGRWEIAW